jgi:hypothetical protein
MKRHDIWCLTIRFWPRAAEADIAPVPTFGFEEGPQYYRPTSLRFDYPPTLGDFMEVYRRTPWMGVWRETLIPILQRLNWPIPAITKKRVTVDLVQDGKQVGELVVEREDLWENQYVERPAE